MPSAKITLLMRRAGVLIRGDFCHFFRRANLLRMLAALIIGALLANSPWDARIHDAWQQHLRTSTGDRIFAAAKQCGYTRTVVPCALAATALGLLASTQPTAVIGAWGANLVRAGLISWPVVGMGQLTLGGNRPSNGDPQGSYWRLFGRHPNGISGHAFGGALPFMIAAEMIPCPVAKVTLYACSVMPGLSRINTSSHYPSQVILGWWFAFLAVRTVFRTASKLRSDSDGAPGRI